VGYNYGAARPDRIREGAKIIYLSAGLTALAGTAVFHLFGGSLLRLFSVGEAMLSLGIPALRIISLTFFPASMTMITGYFASGLGDGVTNMAASFLRQFVPLIPCAFLLARHGGIGMVWYAFWISEAAGLAYALLGLGKMRGMLQGMQKTEA
jgi:Na+-driven multidrug efflux pump